MIWTHWPYMVAAWIFVVGLYGIVTSRDYIHLIMCLAVLQSSTYVLLITIGYRTGATAPIYAEIAPGMPAVDPIVQALMLTDVVVEAVVMALLLALAMQLHQRVSLIHRGPSMGETVKYWVRPDIENRFKKGEITAYFNARMIEITGNHVRFSQNGATRDVRAHQVFALTGYHCSTLFFDQLGVPYDPQTLRADYNPETFETRVAGVYLAGSVVGGRINGEVFIENGRFHGEALIKAIAEK
jgi:multicomponent Na+:H+ antiporter subunit C